MNLQTVKNRFGIIGNSPALNRALDVAVQVAPTDITVLITGESGTGKENMPKIIHHYSSRKHHEYIAVNCGPYQKAQLILNCLDMKKEHSLEQLTAEKVISK